MRILKLSAVVFALIVLLALARRFDSFIPPFEEGVHASTAAGVAEANSHGPHIGPCPTFPADNVWNVAIDHLAVDGHSKDYIASIGGDKKVHPDFGSDLGSGIPFTEVKARTKRVKVNFGDRDESDLSNYPIPPDAPIEGGPNNTGDRHVILVDTDRCLLFELYAAAPKPDGSWDAGSAIIMDLTDNALRGDGKTSADAAGLPILPGLVRYDEVASGEIRHALRFTVPHTQAAYIWPARHKASNSSDPNRPPMGVRLRLRADFDISHFSKTNQVILTAMKRYGMFLADNGSAIFISGVPDKRWDDSDLHRLGEVTAADFEVVNESALQLLTNSGRVDPDAPGVYGH